MDIIYLQLDPIGTSCVPITVKQIRAVINGLWFSGTAAGSLSFEVAVLKPKSKLKLFVYLCN